MIWLMIKTIFDHPGKDKVRAYENIRKRATCSGDEYMKDVYQIF